MRNSREPEQAITVDENMQFVSDAEEFEKITKTTSESAAKQIISAVEKDQRRLLISFDAEFFVWIQRHFPNAYPRAFGLLANLFRR